ncbi:MAG: hypothetical protein Q9218_001868 [Villophora microphyllina]
MAPPRGSAAYKKQDGTLAISKDGQSVSWTPVTPPGSKPAISLAVSAITNLQQTPATTAKVMLKIFAQPLGSSAPETHVFSFTSPTAARAEADAIKDALSKAIQQTKAAGVVPAAPGGSASSAAMAIASAVSSGQKAGAGQDGIYDDARLQSDLELQHSLRKSDPQLSKTFMESLRTKPGSITDTQFTSQFWASRTHLLRAHALEKSQTRGSYNVLASIKPETKDNTLRLSISKEQIQLIFNQHAIVRRAYDENVPKISESDFWVKFFQSRLFKKLKGEKIVEADAANPVLDKYLYVDDEAERAKRLMASHVPHIIDIEGNEENHSQRKGNQPDFTMRPASNDRVPIIRTLNTMSEKLLSQVAPNDIDPALPIGVDEETYNNLALQDLRDENDDDRVILNIKNQSRSSATEDNDLSVDAKRFSKLNPTKTLDSLQADLAFALSPSFSLESALTTTPEDEDSSSDDEPSSQKHPLKAKTSYNPYNAATAQILASIRTNNVSASSATPLNTSSASFSTTATNSTYGLTPTTFDRLSLTHATTTEFLLHFWSCFLSSSDPKSNPTQLPSLIESLDRALDRINAVAEDAEAERNQEVEKVKRQIAMDFDKTGRRRKYNFDSIEGGQGVVRGLLAPTVRAVERAVGAYRKALVEAGVEDGG